MHIERVTLTNFRCFGPDPTTIDLNGEFTAFVGANGTGKTAAFDALGRMFGVNRGDRQVVPEDFHVPFDEAEAPTTRNLSIEVVIAFPELDEDFDAAAGEDEGIGAADTLDEGSASIPEFFRQMAATESGELKCRYRLEATWTDDGSVDGTVVESLFAIRTFEEDYGNDDCSPLRAMDRSRIQMVYLPASRDGARHLTTFLKSRLWRAGQWSSEFRSAVVEAAAEIGEQFRAEPVVAAIEKAVSERWKQLHWGSLETQPTFRPIARDFAQLANKAQLFFTPSDISAERSADQLSDGQRSLLQIALTSAAIGLESMMASGHYLEEFDVDAVHLPSLTLLVVEEPENSLSPHFLSRIISQMDEIGASARAQSLVSSQSASVLGRIDPRSVRHFRLDPASQAAAVNSLKLPADTEAEAIYVREAVQSYPELYFARFVVLCEGSSEQIVIPKLAQAKGILIDQSFVSVVPLGGRHVNHFWRLLSGLGIPHITLLDLDRGRLGGGKGRLQTACSELEAIGIKPLDDLDQFESPDDLDDDDLGAVITALESQGVVFCSPLDLDMSMLTAFPDAYQQLEGGDTGPKDSRAFKAVLGAGGDPDVYEGWDRRMQWYRYLFLGRSKPTTHLRALQRIDDASLRADMPEELETVISKISQAIGG